MSNCNNLFKTFNGNINITSAKKKKLIVSRDNLKEKVKSYFAEKHPEYKPMFMGQGSYSTGTLIRTKDDTCDIDYGIYFFPKPEETGTTIQKWVWKSVEDITSEKPQHKERCIRVLYVNDYHIDLPVYYKESDSNDTEHPLLAVKNQDWSESDPKEFKDWFTNLKDDKGQLVRTVRYLKAWCDSRSKKMPNGLTMTVLSCNNIVFNDRDDISFRDTLLSIKTYLNKNWSCEMPTTPNDDLLENFKGSPVYFFESLDSLIDDANKAIDEEKNQYKASKLWQKHLGKYFPDGEDKDVDKKEADLKAIAASVLAGNARLDNNGKIQEESGVGHLPHRNYGGQ